MKKLITIIGLISISLIGKAQTFSWFGSMPVLDLQTDTIPIVVSGLPSVIDTSFGIGHACVTITHTYDADLLVRLISPDGHIVTLIQAIGGANNNFTGTCLGMDGTSFNNIAPPYTGLVVPIGNLASFNNGQNPNGTWLFLIGDVANSDTGSVHELNLEFTNNPPTQTGSGGSGGPTGVARCATCVCPGGAAACDLLPDMTASALEIVNNHQETPGFLDISNATPNIGYGPIEIYGMDSCFCDTVHVPCGTICPNGGNIKHVVKQRIYQKVPGTDTLSFYDRIAGTMTYHATHGHIHVDNWAYFTLRTRTANPDPKTWPIVGTGTKQSFCLVNLGSCSSLPGECLDNNGNTILTVPNNGVGFHTGCGLNQGIYPGQYDVYSMGLNDPIPLNNVCNGDYYVVSITDPDNNFLESDETNNTVAVPITLTQQSASPTITAGGPTAFCPGDSVTLTSNAASNYLWNTGATTQSIVAKLAGNYTVSSTCGSSTATSAPVTVTIISTPVTPLVSIAITTGSNPTCLNAAVTFTATPTYGGATPAYQWKVNGGNVGTNSPTYTSSTLTTGQIVSCTMTSSMTCVTTSIANSNSITMTVSPAACYCTPIYGTTSTSGCMDNDVIARVILNTLDNNTGTTCPSGIAGYSNYTTSTNPLHTTTLQAGNVYNCTVYTGPFAEGYKVWIDYNNDGTFATSETVANTTTVVPANSSRVMTLTVTCTAPAGPHRMRVRCIYNLAGPTIDPCIYQSNYGETEDYTITIAGSLSCPKPTLQTVTAITSSSATLGWTAGCTETLWNVHVTTPGGGAPSGAPSNPGVGNPFNRTGLAANTQYEFWVAADCNSAGNGTSLWTGPFTFTTLANCSGIAGTAFANPILIGQVPCLTSPFSNTQNNSAGNCFSNNYTGANNQASNDIWYKFTLSASATVQINTCAGSGLADTYLHLLNSAGTQIAVNDDNGPLCSGLRASMSQLLAAGTYYVVVEGYNTNLGIITIVLNTTTACGGNTVLNLKTFLEGYYITSSQMQAVLMNENVAGASTLQADSITVELHPANSLTTIAATVKTILMTGGTATCNFPGAISSSGLAYHIVVRHRGTVETWSGSPILFNSTTSYDFSAAASAAYGDNQIELEPNVWGLYSADMNQDGYVTNIDYTLFDSDNVNQVGPDYVVTDMDGDGYVLNVDYAIFDKNNFNQIGKITP